MSQIQHYLENTYCFRVSSNIIASGSDEYGQWIAPGKNIFHPQGGGQPADRGWVNDIPVTVRKQMSGLVTLYPASPSSLSGETNVIQVLSVDDRVRHAALHTAGHLLNQEMCRYGWLAVKGHHFPGESRVEFSASDSSARPPDSLRPEEIEESIHTQLRSGAPVITWYDGGTRWSQINGTEPIPCAGTHTDDISKISMFTVKAIRYKKGILRISYDAEHIALRDTHDK
ncbi:hypothetical protein FXQ12_17340 [Salmonella enterica]|nr:hypothetical protein [Salmonella enterica]ECC9413310.1 hypothetical protein [Salmonella enterica subsp. enterica]EHF1447784.1 hypothetical protein [Salmonella enterica subsp. enterica serovar 4,5,12:b:-]EHG1527473.1 hypothetical protein [Salmonella enterica subsp. enterica serovar 4,[5],12:b:-]ECD8846933.1 hypothetical protein [Salmonella enterica subsp. enterica]